MITKGDIVNYLHQAAFSPVKSTFLKEIEAGHFTTCTGLTTEIFRKHLKNSLATSKGHLRQEYKNLISTHAQTNTPTVTTPSTSIITSNKNRARTYWVYMKPIEVTEKIYSDQTGQFTITSSRGKK